MPRVCLITGTSRGLGHAMAQVFLDAGDYVVATARNPQPLTFHGTTPHNYLSLKLDVTSPADIDAAFAATLEKFSRVDIVINNAASGLIGPLETLAEDQIRQQFDVNFFGLVRVTQRAISTMRTQSPPGGLIIQISSLSGSIGVPMQSTLSATKFAIEGFTEAVNQEMKREWGIKLVTVKPGRLATEAHTKSMTFGEVSVLEYDHMDGRLWAKSLDSMESTDPMVAAQLVHKLSAMVKPPPRAVLDAEMVEVLKASLEEEQNMLFDSSLANLLQSSDNAMNE